MELLVQLLMGVSLAACCGLRAFLPVLVVGILARGHYIALHPQFAFLGRDDVLVIFGCATVLEILADKIVVLDHTLDVIGTALRPAAGAVLSAAVISKMDPVAAIVLGLVIGGGTALTVHAGKAMARYKSTSLALFHHGSGNAALSLGEDFAVGFGLWTTANAPIVAFLLAVGSIALAICVVRQVLLACHKGMSYLRSRYGRSRNLGGTSSSGRTESY